MRFWRRQSFGRAAVLVLFALAAVDTGTSPSPLALADAPNVALTLAHQLKLNPPEVATPVLSADAPVPAEPVAAPAPWMDGNSGPFAIAPGQPLPSDAECAKKITKAKETQSGNSTANHFVGNARAATARAGVSPYTSRITGNFKGTTDEVIQWAACKWGFDPAPVRAQALVESSMHQTSLGGFETDDGSCADTKLRRVAQPSDSTTTSTSTTTTTTLPSVDGTTSTTVAEQTPTSDVQYECPTAFGMMQIRSDYHPGTYPLSAQSTAFNLDYSLAMKRSCYDGLSGLGSQTKGNAWGCVGAHYAGAWLTGPALDYIDKVKSRLAG